MTSTTASSKTVVGIFDDMSSAESAVRELENSGISRDDISIVANKNVQSETSGSTGASYGDRTDTAPGEGAGHVAADAGIGAALGGVGGLLLSFVGLAIPGVGPVLAMGPLVAALGGAGIGAVAGGVIGALTETGVPEEDAQYYAEGVRRGQVLVTVHTDEGRAESTREVLDRNGAVDVQGRAAAWRERGWTGYNPGAEPLSADELRREREYYSASQTQAEDWEREQREQRQSGSAPEGGTLSGTNYPHPEAYPIGSSLSSSEAQNAATASEQSSRQVRNDMDRPSNYGDAIENNVRRPDSAVRRAEQGLDRAKESAAESARRLGSRIYNRV